MEDLRRQRDKFIAFEGINGSGKTTVMQAVAERVRARPHENKVVTLANPTKGPIGTELRRIVAEQKALGFPMFFSRNPRTIAFATRLASLFIADREAMQEQIANVPGNTFVFIDRYNLSTLVYQCAMIGDVAMESDLAKMIRTAHAQMISPGKTIILDVPVPVARFRLAARGEKVDDTMMATIDPVARSMYLDAHDTLSDGDGGHTFPIGWTHEVNGDRPLDEVVESVFQAIDIIHF